MKNEKPYKRLPGRYRSSTGERTLWLGADHLLAADRVYFEDRYRRFYFSDIQAFVVQATNRWHVITAILAVLTLALLTPGWLFWQKKEYEIAFMAVLPAALVFIALVVNLAKGKSCRCSLQMKVGIHDLPSIRRMRQAGKVLLKIRPLVNFAQKGVQVSTGNSSAPVKKVLRNKVETLHPYSGRWHLALFGVLAVDMAGSVWHFLSPGRGLYLLNILLGTAVLLLAIAGLVAQRNTRLPNSVRMATWIVLGIYVAYMIAGYFYVLFYFMMKDPSLLADQSRQYYALSSLQLLEHPFLAVITALYIVIGVFCTVSGLAGIIRMRRESTAKGSV